MYMSENENVELNNSAECLGYLCLFVSMNDGELHEEEAKRTLQAMAKMINGMEIDVDGDGEVTVDDLKTAYLNVLAQFPKTTAKEAAKHFVGICTKYFDSWPDINKQIIVKELAEVAKADNVIQDVEKSNVNYVAEMFGVDKPF
jgi:hypothetical protein